MNKHLSILLLALCLAAGTACAGDAVVSFKPDTVRVLRNPLCGWVMYVGRGWDADFWQKEGYDAMSVGDSTVRVSDYANTCYIRTSWSSMEPEEGKYFWLDPSSKLNRLLKSATDRGMKLAFRIVVDSRDQGQNTPLYVKEAGAKGFQDPGNPKNWSPYPDDPVFQEKYAKFLKALATEFNDPDKVDFIDAFGLGKWGEAHGLVYGDYGKKELEGVSPVALGDGPKWTSSNPPESMFSVYSTSPVGILGAMVRTTDVEAILGIDCNVTDFYAARPYPVHLYYNPYMENKTVTYTVSGEGPVDLFDIISRKYLAENASGTAKVTLPADNAAVIVEVPAGTDIVKSGDRLVDKSDNNKIISYR